MGDLVAIEGLDGSGKETQTKLLVNALRGRGFDVATLSFPRYGRTSAVLAEEYLRGSFGTNPSCVNAYGASSFFAMDRFASYLLDWKAKYEQADVFLADRYVTSNAIHQCSKLPREQWESFLEWLFDYEHDKLGLPRPSKVFYLHIDVDTSQRLLEERYDHDELRKDIHEHNLEYLRNSQEAAEFCCKTCGWVRVECVRNDALRPVDDIHAEIVSYFDAGDDFGGHA